MVAIRVYSRKKRLNFNFRGGLLDSTGRARTAGQGRLVLAGIGQENTLVGVEAAHPVGMKAVAVATAHATQAISPAGIAFHRLDELTFDRVLTRYCGVRASIGFGF